MKFGLENMRTLCAALGRPERAFPSVIVGGTNGKGSVTAMVSTALHAAGHRVGRYTSPHLERLEERFVIDEQEVETGELREAAAVVQQSGRAAGRGPAAGRAPDVLRVRDRDRLRVVPPAGCRDCPPGGRPGRPPRRNQRRLADRRGDHLDRLRPSGAARQQPRGNRHGEGGHHQAGDPGGVRPAARGSRSGHGGDLQRTGRGTDPRARPHRRRGARRGWRHDRQPALAGPHVPGHQAGPARPRTR